MSDLLRQTCGEKPGSMILGITMILVLGMLGFGLQRHGVAHEHGNAKFQERLVPLPYEPGPR